MDEAQRLLDEAHHDLGDEFPYSDFQRRLDRRRQELLLAQLLNEARHLIERQELARALEPLRQAAQIEPDDAEIRAFLEKTEADLEWQQREHRRQETASRIVELLNSGQLEAASDWLEQAVSEFGERDEMKELRARLEELQEQKRRAQQTVVVEDPPRVDEKTVCLDVDETVCVSPSEEATRVEQRASPAVADRAIREFVHRRRFAVVAAVSALLAVVGGAAIWWSRPLAVKPTGTVKTPQAFQPVTGRLIINAIPWGRLSAVVDKDGQLHPERVGTYTPVAVDLPPGRYKIRLVNDGFDEPRELDVEVRSRETARCLGQFTEVSIDEFFEQLGW